MQIKRTTSRNQYSEIDDFINQLLISHPHDNNSWIQSHINNQQVQKYFANLHKHITIKNLHHLKAYESLIDGLYVLLKGEIKFMFDEANTQKSKMKKSKSSKSSPYTAGVIINQTWSVFECTYKNCTANTQSYLLRITDEQATLSKFFELFSVRNDLYLNRYLSQDHHKFYDIPELDEPFYVNLKIHSNFSFKTFYFRQILSLLSPAIIVDGRAKLKVAHFSSHQFDKYGVLLPNIKYEVLSSQISLMIIQNNQTLSYNFQIQLDKFIKPKQSAFVSSVYKTEMCTPKYSETLQGQKEQERKNKQKSKIFKQSQQYSIISTFLCQKSLNFAKKHNFIHHTKQKKQNRCKSPLILFDIANQNSKISTPKFQSIHSITPNETNTKYLSAHKISSQSQCSQSNLLRKIKLSPTHYTQISLKNQKKSLQNLNKHERKLKKVFHLTLEKILSQKAHQGIK